MVEIYKDIAYYMPLFNQIFDDKNKNNSVKEANINLVKYMLEIYKFVRFDQSI